MLYFILQTEDEILQNTTPMYRTPEMIDMYSNYPINEMQDVWVSKQTISIKFTSSHLPQVESFWK